MCLVNQKKGLRVLLKHLVLEAAATATATAAAAAATAAAAAAVAAALRKTSYKVIFF